MRGKLKKALSNVLTVAMFASLLPMNAVTVMAADVNPGGTTGARSATVSNNVFLGNDKLELGINQCGSFGSTAAAPSNFHPDQIACGGSNKYLGM
jgi:hypothetical protein